MTPLQPVNLALSPDQQLTIDWSDGTRQIVSVAELRKACPCATCREKRQAPAAAPNPFAVLKPAEAQPLSLLGMQPVGNYAYSLNFSDGHDTGIYTFDFLRQHGQITLA